LGEALAKSITTGHRVQDTRHKTQEIKDFTKSRNVQKKIINDEL